MYMHSQHRDGVGAGTGALEALHELLAQAHFVVVHALQAAQLALVQLLL